MNSDNLKDVILSTIAEFTDELPEDSTTSKNDIEKELQSSTEQLHLETQKLEKLIEEKIEEQPKQIRDIDDEVAFIKTLQEEITIFFQGLQSPDLVEANQKMDLVIKYLQNLLILLEERIRKLEELK
ncbi:MAG TPA: hypothetical protein EYO61_04880 [Campylobacterales bacterium]|nr:hypothetical protein [Campylobacterales bacterium]HIO71058.1 hypothetical protein [Campylobacterales bacterium]